ncbi:glycosyltransferase [Streptomyces aurantiacus]|uniref:Putative Lipopolysaccharide core biosynthesis mannosyltransferase LpcC n=1 Tax=Streptomyces aurantiacus JA 4570 TaxID=1286094 RepID=S3ZPW1_9ACTN|nr:glycosyltransferase [Streptomyces aurantiacus]EPH40400.1 putative Lipopolysaccharide core biosynthesis mannosyltransferase LpcC [Streptomyces aurantiacus JA 4570]
MHPPSNSSPAPRVLHVSQPVDGGVARVVTDLVRAQRAAGMDVHLACPDGGTLARSAAPVPVHPWAAARSPGPGLRSEVRDLAEVVYAVRPTLVHAHSAKAGLAARVAVRGRVPTVFQPHAWSFEAVDGSLALLARTWERHAARWTARTLCVSEAERDTGRRAGIAGPCSVVPNGVDPEHFVPADPRAARARLLFPDHVADAPLVVCVGRLCRQKGQDVLLRAWAEVAAGLPGARLVLVGDGPDATALRAQAHSLALGSVTFAGAADDVASWYQAADVVVLPSRWEGMALAPLEAMACARAVLLTDVDGARESLPAAHHAHALVPSEDPAALAAALTVLLRDPALRDALGGRGRAHVLDHHDARRTAAAVEAVYRELLGTAPTEHRECSTT